MIGKDTTLNDEKSEALDSFDEVHKRFSSAPNECIRNKYSLYLDGNTSYCLGLDNVAPCMYCLVQFDGSFKSYPPLENLLKYISSISSKKAEEYSASSPMSSPPYDRVESTIHPNNVPRPQEKQLIINCLPSRPTTITPFNPLEFWNFINKPLDQLNSAECSLCLLVKDHKAHRIDRACFHCTIAGHGDCNFACTNRFTNGTRFLQAPLSSIGEGRSITAGIIFCICCVFPCSQPYHNLGQIGLGCRYANCDMYRYIFYALAKSAKMRDLVVKCPGFNYTSEPRLASEELVPSPKFRTWCMTVSPAGFLNISHLLRCIFTITHSHNIKLESI